MVTRTRRVQPPLDAVPQLAGFDNLTYSSQARISQAIRAKLDQDKEIAQALAHEGATYCPEWLGAHLLPNGGRGYSFIVETEDFTVKVAGENMLTWPGLYVELRSFFLHTHEGGARGAVEESLAWIRAKLLHDQKAGDARALCSFETVTPSRFDLHIDWQGGFAPTFDTGEVERFIKPRRVKWHPYFEGNRCTGYRFGSDAILARLYNKTVERKTRQDDGYFALLAARNPAAFDPDKNVWRLEFQVRREGMRSFRLAPELDASEGDDLDLQVAAELSAEELPHLATFPKLFAHADAFFQHLTAHWLRLTTPGRGKVRSRWKTNPTWDLLRASFARLADAPPLDAEGRELVRAYRYEGRQRLLRRMTLGVVKALEVQDTSVASASLRQLGTLADLIAAKEEKRLKARKAAAEECEGTVPQWVEVGMGASVEHPEKVKHLVQMLLGIFAAHGVLALGDKPVMSVGDLLTQHLELLEAEAEDKGGVGRVLAEHYAKVYKVALPLENTLSA